MNLNLKLIIFLIFINLIYHDASVDSEFCTISQDTESIDDENCATEKYLSNKR